MDKMAYLQQISTSNNAAKKGKNSALLEILKKIVTVRNGIILGIIILVLVVGSVVLGELTKVDTRDQDLLKRSYFMVTDLMDETMDEYAEDVKNSDIRDMSASFKSIMTELQKNDADLLSSFYGVEDVSDEDEGDIATDEKNKNDELNSTLEDARLSGRLDRVYLREMTMQIAYLISYQSECGERTKNQTVKDTVNKSEESLKTLYEKFNNFESPTI